MNPIKKLARKIRSFATAPVLQRQERSTDLSQLQLKLQYAELARTGAPLPNLRDVGFRVYSESDEDGILLYIFSLIGMQSRSSVELCAGNGMDANTANLIINHGWHGLLIEGDSAQVARGREFYKHNPHTRFFPPTFLHEWVTRENVNDILTKAGFTGAIDLLSLDMDGMDYWIWNALECIQPRVVVLEYQDIIGPGPSITVPYSKDFYAYDKPSMDSMPNYSGASLRAFTKLGKKKGYRLVGCNRYGYNAFFIRDGLGEEYFPEVDVESCFFHPKYFTQAPTRWETVKHLEWVEI